MVTRFSVVTPIHNEAELLPYTLPTVYAMKPDEAIFFLDNCTDDSLGWVKAAAAKYPKTKTRILFTDKSMSAGWAMHQSWIRRYGHEVADYDTIFYGAGDLLLDPKIGDYIRKYLSEYALVSFGFYERNLQAFARLFNSYVSRRGWGGIIAFNKEAAKLEDIDDLKLRTYGEDTHLRTAIEKQYKTKHINTRTIHTRPRENLEEWYFRGIQNWEYPERRSMLGVFIKSVVMIRPSFFVGYYHYRHDKGLSFREKIYNQNPSERDYYRR